MTAEIMILIAFIFILGGTGIVLMKAIKGNQSNHKKPDPEKKKVKNVRTAEDKGNREKLGNLLGFNGLRSGTNGTTVQEFLPFEKIEDSMICLGNDIYRMAIEVNSINYYLKTEEEQDTVEAQYRRAISSWHFPWAVYVQTREFDNRKNVEDLSKQVKLVCSIWPKLSEYSRNYLQFVEELPKTTNSGLTKKKFIIIGCDDAYKLKTASAEDKQEYALQQMFRNAQLIINSLKNVGLSAHICRSDELTKMMYQAIIKNTGGAEDGLIDQSFMVPVVQGEKDDIYRDVLDNHKLDLLVGEFLNRIDTEMINDRSNGEVQRATIQSVRSEVEQLRKNIKAAENQVEPKKAVEDPDDESTILIPPDGIYDSKKHVIDEDQKEESSVFSGGEDETVWQKEKE